jgi:excisionase family DNA binding protein
MPLTAKQAAELLGINEFSVRRAILEGRLKAGRFGRWCYAIEPSAIREYVINHPRPSRVAHINVHSLV